MGLRGLVGRLPHLALRFFGSLRPGGPSAVDELWAESYLVPGEVDLWRRLSNPDRRHLVKVARNVVGVLGDDERPVVAAALLHDVGKLGCGLGTMGRVVATLVIAGTSRSRLEAWAGGRGFTGRVGRYFCHPESGAVLLEEAGSDSFTVAWAREHQNPSGSWSVDAGLAEVLAGADR
ncbi:MAG: hypothetical protein HN979_02965 [Actinobacteria bacterium]|nr:hypothetical protein [Actinomycetota bacterium]MDP7550821.1 hypothetical protein [Acidimicrobiales bacterium]MBT3687381.1 hypothetical protein [Actinomycetota bacterium]MBT4037911.1 hypothetical protein [Actinomycetota bacterium]MBT4278952.1 hypothetical protein [Actinomycetota bacterium]